jgi:hypothetical protein
MSRSETEELTGTLDAISRLSTELEAQADALLAHGSSGALPDEVIRRLVTAAARLYTARSEATGVEANPLRDDVGATEAVVLACALIRARDLNPFDLALWFSRAR